MTVFEALREQLAKYKQDHILEFWSELSDDQRKELIEDINELNFDEVNLFFERATASLEESGEKLDDKLKPIPEAKFLSIAKTAKEHLDIFKNEGLRRIAANQVGVLLLAGGQGTRLGFSHPKGMYNIGLPSNKTLFCVQAERIVKLQQLAAELTGCYGRITWYIMTSEHTKQPTQEYFEMHDFFGLREEDIVMFEQGSLPCYDMNGKIFLDEKHRVAKSPDGNGGLYRALRDRGILDDMERRGVLYLHAHSVDNILIKVADPVFIGYCVAQKSDCAAKVVEKAHAHEAVGVVCIVDGKYQVVEYSEITNKTAEMRNVDGKLTFSAGNICNHFFTTRFLRKIGDLHEKELKLHVAKKKIPHIELVSGSKITPDKINGIKIEKFIFDVFQFAEKFVAVEVPRDEEFSALKNADSVGKDCASTAKLDIYRLHKKYIEEAGGTIEGDECEISPLLSYAGEGLKPIVNDQHFICPVYLCAENESYQNGHLN
uniref:UDP-N-acetylglucosamine diphosphorylase n=1 Tax=Corethrella appendiculata TaxID=1370023 RepID=U5EJU3_9DIPT